MNRDKFFQILASLPKDALDDAGINLEEEDHVWNRMRKWHRTRSCPRRTLILLLATELSTDDLAVKPRGETNFPCRNKFADCYLKQTAALVKTLNYRCTFRCRRCQFEYQLKARDVRNNVPGKRPRFSVKNTGKEWDKKFRILWTDARLTSPSLARLCDLRYRSTIRESKRLGFPPRNCKWWMEAMKQPDANTPRFAVVIDGEEFTIRERDVKLFSPRFIEEVRAPERKAGEIRRRKSNRSRPDPSDLRPLTQ